MSLTTDQLESLDRLVQVAQDDRLAWHLTVIRAGIPETGEPLYPGVPVGTECLPVAPRLSAEEIAEVLGVLRGVHS